MDKGWGKHVSNLGDRLLFNLQGGPVRRNNGRWDWGDWGWERVGEKAESYQMREALIRSRTVKGFSKIYEVTSKTDERKHDNGCRKQGKSDN